MPLSTKYKFNAAVILITIIFSCIVIYWQNLKLNTEYNSDINSKLKILQTQWDSSLFSYDNMLKAIGKNIASNNTSKNNQAISSALKQLYVHSKDVDNKSTAIDFSDINWASEGRNVLVSRYGVILSEKLPTDLENNLRTFPNKLYIYSHEINDNELGNGSNSYSELLLIMGLLDHNKNYMGKLSIKLDIESWIQNINFDLNKYGYVFAIVDYNDKVLFFSNKELLYNSVPITGATLNSNLSNDYFIFENNIDLDPYPYMIVFGYKKNIFYKQLIQNSLPLLVFIWTNAFIFLIIQSIIYINLKKEINKGFVTQIDNLTKNNTKYQKYKLQNQKKNLQIISKLNSQIANLTNRVKRYISLIEAYDLSMREKHKLQSMLGARITDAIAEVREVTRIIADIQNGSLNIAINNKKQIALLADTNDKLAYLSIFCVIRGADKQIKLQEIIRSTLDIYAKEIIEFNLNIKIDNKIDKIFFDELLLRQILANLLRESVGSSKPNGKINIVARLKRIANKEFMVLTIKDNGLGILSDRINSTLKFDEEQEEQLDSHQTSTLTLDINTIRGIVESFDGSLVTECTIGKGKVIILSLLCSLMQPPKKSNIYGDNVVIFKKP